MRTELGLLVAVAVIAGLGLLARTGPPEPIRSGVVLNRTVPAPSGSRLEWAPWDRLAAVPRTGAETRPDGPAVRPAPAQQSAAPAGIWATPAEFAESD